MGPLKELRPRSFLAVAQAFLGFGVFSKATPPVAVLVPPDACPQLLCQHFKMVEVDFAGMARRLAL